MKVLNFPVVKFTFFIILGIILGFYTQPSIKTSISISVFCIGLLSILWLFFKNKSRKNILFGFSTFITFSSLGILVFCLNLDTNYNNHYTKMDLNTKEHLFKIKITEELKPTVYNKRYLAEIQQIDSTIVFGSILLYVNHNSFDVTIDNEIITHGFLKEINAAKNPYQFDYKDFLKKRNIYNQLELNKSSIISNIDSTKSLKGFASNVRTFIDFRLKKVGFKPETLAIINAMLLGNKNYITKDIYNNYVNSGTIHLLAISGLHIGILLLFLNAIFKPLLHVKNGNVYRLIIVVSLIWLFAIITGLSPSVSRAATMFSILNLGITLNKSTNTYNTLAISAFILLLINPFILFEVGFQLSYLAVIGIISFQPILYKFWKPKHVITNTFWQIFTVTLAAQIGILPLSLFYFHQFSGLFFISNLIIIPIMGLVLGLGIIVILFSCIKITPVFLVKIYDMLISNLNSFINWIAHFEDFIFKDIAFSFLDVIGYYILIIVAYKYLKKPSLKHLKPLLLSIIIIQLITIYQVHSVAHDFIIFNQNKSTSIAIGNSIYTDSLSESTKSTYKTGYGFKTLNINNPKHFYIHNTKNILLVDSLGIYKNIAFNIDIIILSKSPKINLTRLIDTLNPEIIVADASNYKSYVKRWKETCEKMNIPFHSTYEKGYYKL